MAQTQMPAKIELPGAIPGFSEFGHISFEGLRNTRDLGGLPAADGRRGGGARAFGGGGPRPGSGRGTESDLARLLADYRLEGVVDFRTEMERDKEPDPRERMEGVVFYDFPALSGETIGITHGASLTQDVKTLEAVSAQPHEAVRKMYPQILLGEAGRAAYRGLLDVLLESDGGAVLWHCTEGKDRAGLGAVVVERALGVPEADVRADYLATNLFARSRAEGVLDALAAKLPALRGVDADVDSFFYAYADYYDAAMGAVTDAFGTFDAYLTEALDFGPEKQVALREKYLA